MAESTNASASAERGLTSVVETIRSVLSSVWTLFRWIALLVIGVTWLAFWANLARHHLSMGNSTAVVISAVPMAVPPVLVLVERYRR